MSSIYLKPLFEKKADPVNWLFTITIKKKISHLIKFLNKFGIESRPIFYPFNKTRIFKRFLNKDVKFTNSESLFRNGLSLPTYNGIKKNEIKYICTTIDKFCYEKK